MTGTPTTCYASGPRGALAYQVTGTGPVDLLMAPGMHSHLELQWQLPGYRRFVRGLSRHCRLIRYDKLGTGLSDPTVSTPTVGERVEDLAAVAAACAARAPVPLGFSEGGPLAIRFAVIHRVSGLVLYGTSVRPPPPKPGRNWTWSFRAGDRGGRSTRLRRAWLQIPRPAGLPRPWSEPPPARP